LIYPATEKTQEMNETYCFKSVDSHKDVPLGVVFFDLVNDCFISNVLINDHQK
jgi:hypothetical protein